ncbi:MAG: leucine-rich repeat domain-containing protein [Bacteroidia bacterium]|nr:leucine-rich repeat domain-containing protein [Bacteroidia bacterium]
MMRMYLFVLAMVCTCCIFGCSEGHTSTPIVPLKLYESLDEALKEPSQVKKLSLKDIGDSLSPEIGKLVNLESLLIEHSSVKYLPDSFVNLVRLNALYIRDCGFESIPKQLFGLKNLRSLSITMCNIESIPPELASLQNLWVFSLRANRLKEFPRGRVQTRGLSTLSLESNLLTTFDYTKEDFPVLTYLSLSFNPLPDSLKKRLRQEFSYVTVLGL